MYLEHTFDVGLPLDGDWQIDCNIAGKCTVAYDSAGEWWIEEIYVNISKRTNSERMHRAYLLDKTKPKERRWYHELRTIIADTDRAEIDEAVSERLPDTYEPHSAISAGRTL